MDMSSFARRLVALEQIVKRLLTGDAMWESLSWVPYLTSALQPYSVSGSNTHVAAQPGIALTLCRFGAAVRVTTTNDANNYWDITLLNIGGSTLATATTSAIAADTWVWVTATAAWTNPIASSNAGFIVQITKAGSGAAPGTLRMAPYLGVRNGSA